MRIGNIIKIAAFILLIVAFFPLITAGYSSFTSGLEAARKADRGMAVNYNDEEKIEIAKRNWSKTCPRIMKKIESASEEDKQRADMKKLIDGAQWCYDDRIRPKQ